MRKNGVNLSKELNEQATPGELNPRTAKITANTGKRMSVAGKIDDVASEKITQIELARDARIAKKRGEIILK